MSGVIETACGAFWYSGQSTSGAFGTKINTVTKPSGALVFDMSGGAAIHTPPASVQNNLLIKPNGVGANDTTFDFRVWGVNPYHNASAVNPDKKVIWDYTLLLGLVCTLNSTFVGVDGAALENEVSYADTVTLRTGEGGASGVGYEIVSLAGIHEAYIKLDVLGFWLIEFEFDMTGATSGGVLVKGF